MSEHSLETIEIELANLIRRVTSLTTNKKMGNFDRSAYLLLNQITSHGPAGIKALANELQLDISTVSRQAAALELKGYVYKIPDPIDGRAYFLQITDLGIKEFKEYKNLRLVKLAQILKNWSNEECSAFGQLLKKYNRSVIDVLGETINK